MLAAEGRVVGRDEALEGSLRVSTMDLFFKGYCAVFQSFLVRYPMIALTVSTSDDEVSLTRRQADVVLRMTNSPPEYLVGRKVGRIDFAIYAKRELVTETNRRWMESQPRKVRKSAKAAPLIAYPWLNWDERLNQPWLDDWLEKNVPGARTALRLDTRTLGLHGAVCAGLGVHFLACFDADADPAIERIGEVEPGFSRDLWLLTLRELRSTPRVRAFMDHVEESLAR